MQQMQGARHDGTPRQAGVAETLAAPMLLNAYMLIVAMSMNQLLG